MSRHERDPPVRPFRDAGSGTLLVLFLLALPGCTLDPDRVVQAEHPLHPGVWRGDVHPAGGAPFGALFHVAASKNGPTLRVESPYVSQAFTDVRAIGDTLRFTWPRRTPRDCVLLRREDGGWQGTCRGGEAGSIDLQLVPPAHDGIPTGTARAAYESGISWSEERIGRLHVLIRTGGAADAHAARLRSSAVATFDAAFALLEETPPDLPFWIVYVDSRADIAPLAGRPVGGWADGIARTAVNTATADGRSPDLHEMVHVAAAVAWGVPAAPWSWINEGLAIHAAEPCAGTRVHALAAALVEAGATVPLHRLIHGFTEVDEVSAYLQSASVVGYLRAVYGIAAIRAIRREGPAALPAVTGSSVDALERDWRAFVARVPAAPDALEAVRVRGCL
jgi:hypothetical protein